MKKRAIDLYSGIGGWTLGFKLAGVEMKASYEKWAPAIETHEANFDSPVINQDIRELVLSSLPKKIDYVVGSPPCTQFSFANRGGSGNIEDGLKDIVSFLRVVQKLKPKFWAMENVPRVKKILDKLLDEDDEFQEFAGLFKFIEVIDSSDYGLPQSRKRMIAGNFSFELLEQYKNRVASTTMGDVLSSLDQSPIKDFTYGFSKNKGEITGLENEPFLTEEETRMNRDRKTYHSVYNKMSFPDGHDRPSRTITSTCTRISRESIIIKLARSRKFRRLNLRERACIQGFPITFDFFGKSYSQRLKQVGNAVPPVLSYYIAHAMLGTKPDKVKPICKVDYNHPLPKPRTTKVRVKTARSKYPASRSFNAAIPCLRFGSGMRFDFSNFFIDEAVCWQIRFLYGPSKKFLTVKLNGQYQKLVKDHAVLDVVSISEIQSCLKSQKYLNGGVGAASLQNDWNKKRTGKVNPFCVLDALGEISVKIQQILRDSSKALNEAPKALPLLIDNSGQKFLEDLPSGKKLRRYAPEILAGIITGSFFNSNSALAKPVKFS